MRRIKTWRHHTVPSRNTIVASIVSRVDDTGPLHFSFPQFPETDRKHRVTALLLTPKFRALENQVVERGSDTVYRGMQPGNGKASSRIGATSSLTLILHQRRTSWCKGLERRTGGTSREAASLVWNLISSTDGNALSYSGSPLPLIAFS